MGIRHDLRNQQRRRNLHLRLDFRLSLRGGLNHLGLRSIGRCRNAPDFFPGLFLFVLFLLLWDFRDLRLLCHCRLLGFPRGIPALRRFLRYQFSGVFRICSI